MREWYNSWELPSFRGDRSVRVGHAWRDREQEQMVQEEQTVQEVQEVSEDKRERMWEQFDKQGSGYW